MTVTQITTKEITSCFVPVGGGPFGQVGGPHSTGPIIGFPLPVVTHALQEEERLLCVDLFTQPPPVLKASGITDVTRLSVVTCIHVQMPSSAHAQPPFS